MEIKLLLLFPSAGGGELVKKTLRGVAWCIRAKDYPLFITEFGKESRLWWKPSESGVDWRDP